MYSYYYKQKYLLKEFKLNRILYKSIKSNNKLNI